jgi:glycosyltransferase involved in cell wall biosynthesis
MNPLVSAIIPVYNGEKYLEEAIQSIISQTYRPIQIIVVDDGSTDGSRDIVKSFHDICYIYQANSGHASARNRGIQHAKDDFLAFLDADDLWLPVKLEHQMVAFSTERDFEMVTGYIDPFISPELDVNDVKNIRYHPTSLPGYHPDAILIRRDVFLRIGPFHEQYRVGEAISWFSKAMDMELKIKVLPILVARRRLHGGNISIRNHQEKNKVMLSILKTSLDRKRSNAAKK